MEYKHTYEDGEWKRKHNEDERMQTEQSRIEELRRLRDLHSDLNEQMDGWEDVLAETREKLERATQ